MFDVDNNVKLNGSEEDVYEQFLALSKEGI